MKWIICGTNRAQSNTMKIAKIVQDLYQIENEEVGIIDLGQLELEKMADAPYSDRHPQKLADAVKKINEADGIIVVVPEYNGSMPGILKYFIDHWKYPQSFEARPVALIGIGGRFGGVRPVEHLQQVFGFRNSYVFPERVFISNVWSVIKDDKISDQSILDLMSRQVRNFQKFVTALQSQSLDANSLKA